MNIGLLAQSAYAGIQVRLAFWNYTAPTSHSQASSQLCVAYSTRRSLPLFLIFHLCMREPGQVLHGELLLSCNLCEHDIKLSYSLANWIYTASLVTTLALVMQARSSREDKGKPHSPDFCGGHRNVGSTNQIGEYDIGHMISIENKSVQPTRLGSPHDAQPCICLVYSGYDVSRVCCVLVTPERQLQMKEMSEDRRECDIMCYDCMCPFWGFWELLEWVSLQ